MLTVTVAEVIAVRGSFGNYLKAILGQDAVASQMGKSPFNVRFVSRLEPETTMRAVLLLNGHNAEKMKAMAPILRALDKYKILQSVGLVILASESCNNQFLMDFIHRKHKFKIKFVFLVYGGPQGVLADPPIFHWPLGPAYYRGFPSVKYVPSLATPTSKKRAYLCNFIGTVYTRSSARQTVVDVLEDPANSRLNCSLEYRREWKGSETKKSRDTYIDTLKKSDYTLCPPGYNVEAYRIYEAMTFGSVPILQYGVKRVTGDLQGDNYKCADSFRLLKEHNAPVIWLDDWSELTDVLNRLQAETPEQTYQRRLLSFITTWSSRHCCLPSNFFFFNQLIE
jgi:hypothetical protein